MTKSDIFKQLSDIFLKKILGAIVLGSICLPIKSDIKEDRKAYLRQYSETAVNEMYRSGIPASITLGQGLLESAAGKSYLAVKANNHFGIKCHNWKGETIYSDDDRPNECFRKYRSADESYRDHSDFLRYNDRYKFLFDLEPTDYKAWAYGLKKAGYATDPEYASKLIRLIEDYRLWEYDQAASEAPDSTSSKKEEKPEDNGGIRRLPLSPSRIETPAPIDDRQRETFSFNLSRKMYSLNGVAFVYAEKGETYESIARDFHLFKKEILRFNDLSSPAELHPGDIVYIQKKKNQAAKDLNRHVWTEGDNLWKVSQRYAVRLSALKKLNKDTDYFEEGDLVTLRK